MNMIIRWGVIAAITLSTVSCSTLSTKDQEAQSKESGVWHDTTDRPVVMAEPPPVISSGMGAQHSTGDLHQPPKMDKNPTAGKIVTKTGTYISLGSGEFVRSDDKAKKKKLKGGITLNYKDADIREVIKGILGDILDANYFIDANINGQVTLGTSRPIEKSKLIPTLEAILKMNKAMLMKSNGLYQIVPESTDVSGSASSGLALSSEKGYQILIVPLRYISANEMQKILGPIKSRNSKVEADDIRNIVVLAGTQSELLNMKQIIDTFDVDQLKGMSVGVYNLSTVDAKTMIEDLENIFGDAVDGLLSGVVRFVPIERLNSLLVITPQRDYLNKVGEWIARLDVAAQGSGSGLHVYKVQNGKAATLAKLLTTLFSDGKAKSDSKSKKRVSSAPKPLGSAAKASTQADSEIQIGNISIVADEENNLLVVRATLSEYAKIEQALVRLDVLPRQVLVEVSIVEVSLDESLEYGIQWFLNNGRNTANFSSIIPSGGFSYSMLDSNGLVKALLATLASDSKANVISSPSLMVLDNRTATIRVGDQVPVRTSETTNTSSAAGSLITSTIQYRDTGIILKVKPRVNAGGMVIMEVSQEVSDVSESAAGGVPSPTIETRSIDTHIAVQSGETIVLGGLIKERENNTSSGIPGLRSLPIIGGLFSGSSKNKKRTELVVMITPSTVANRDEARQVTREYQMGMKRLLQSF